MSADLDGPPGRRAITAIAIGAVAIDSALLGLVAPLLPEIQARTGAGDEAVGLALAAYAVPIALFSLPLGRAADALGRRKLLVAGLALVAAGSVLVAVTHSVGALMAAGASRAWARRRAGSPPWPWSPTRRPRRPRPGPREGARGHRHRSIVGPALGGVTADLLSFEAPFLIAAGCALVLLVAALIVLPPEAPRPRSTTPAFATILGACRSGAGAWAAAMIVITSFVLGLIEVVAPLDLDARLGLSASVIGLLFAASIAVDAVFAPFGGRWGDREGRAYPAFVGLLGTALSAVLLAVLPGVVGTIVALVVYGAGFSLAISAAVPWLDEAFAADERGLAYGVQNLLYAGGYAVGPAGGRRAARLERRGPRLRRMRDRGRACGVGLWFRWPAEEKTGDECSPSPG